MKIHVSIEVPMHTAVVTGCTILVLTAQQSAALELPYTILTDWRNVVCNRSTGNAAIWK